VRKVFLELETIGVETVVRIVSVIYATTTTTRRYLLFARDVYCSLSIDNISTDPFHFLDVYRFRTRVVASPFSIVVSPTVDHSS
jgi:hypothetical protein